jgi:hypothetical protein
VHHGDKDQQGRCGDQSRDQPFLKTVEYTQQHGNSPTVPARSAGFESLLSIPSEQKRPGISVFPAAYHMFFY